MSCLGKLNKGIQVLEMLDKVKPDGIFLDINMLEHIEMVIRDIFRLF